MVTFGPPPGPQDRAAMSLSLVGGGSAPLPSVRSWCVCLACPAWC